MPRLEPHPRYRDPAAFDPAHLLRRWIALGVLVLMALPTTQWHNHSIGWLPYWLVLAPTISLALLRRQRLAVALAGGWRQLFGVGRRRRKPGARRLRRARAVAPIGAVRAA